jgi:phosphoglycerate dehydrogenase-like enzyme
VTHWGCPQFSSAVLANAERLKLIAHAAGSVADLVTPEVYTRGIRVASANSVMAKYVAEGVLAYILAGLKRLPQQARHVRYGGWHQPDAAFPSLFEARVGLVGLGTIGRFLLDLLRPFHARVKVYDPYLPAGALDAFTEAESAGLEEVLAWGDVISIHASLTRETRGLLDARRLALIRDGALLVNTARGPIIAEDALIAELRAGRIHAVLDVYTHEPLAAASPLRTLDSVTAFPHSAGTTARGIEMTYAMLDEIARFARGEPLQYEISLEKCRLMTQQRDFDIYTG